MANFFKPSSKSAFICLGFIFVSLFSLICKADVNYIQDHTNRISRQLINDLEGELDKIQSKQGLRIEAIILDNYASAGPERVAHYYYKQLLSSDPEIYKKLLIILANDEKDMQLRMTDNITEKFTTKELTEFFTAVRTTLATGNLDESLRKSIAGIMFYYNDQALAPQKKSMNTGFIFNTIIVGAIIVLGLILFRRHLKQK